MSILVSVLEALLQDEADENTGQLSQGDSRRIARMVREWLEISDQPSSREPYQIADFIYWNCWSASRDAADRWLASLTESQRASLMLGDVLMALQPGLEGDIGRLADENEAERGIHQDGSPP